MMLFALGIFLGYLSATITESLGHKFTGHPGSAQRKIYFKFPRIFAPFLKPLYQHLTIHHHKTFRSEFFEQFSDEDEKKRLDSWIAQRFSPEFSSLVWKERYNLTLVGVAGTLPFALPFCLGPLVILATLGKLPFLGSLVLAFSPVWLSKFVHPLIHKPEETARFHPLIQWLMKTKYMRLVLRNHYLHHQQLETNFNLLLGGDFLVNLHRTATKEEETELQKTLAEFDRRVRLPLKTNSSSSMSLREFQEKEHAYLQLKNPTYEERFQYQRWHHDALKQAKKENWQDILDALEQGDSYFGMKIYDKHISLDSWAKRKEFSIDAYETHSVREERIVYRNAIFETGDFLLTNQESNSDGLYSTLLEGKINFAHVGLFVVLHYKDKKLPAVIEMNELGVRAVPLKAFLSKYFGTYIEVFRLKNSPSKETKSKLSHAALELMAEDHAFDIYQDASQSYYLNCARTITEIYRRAGHSLELQGIRYSEKTIPNLRILGKEECLDKSMLMPDDFTQNPNIHLAAVVDNNQFESLVARALIRNRIQEIWRHEVLDSKQFPFIYRVHKKVIQSIQNDTLLSPLFLRLIKRKREQFPSGPLVFLSLASTANKRMELAVRILNEDLKFHRKLLFQLESWQAFEENVQIRTLVLKASASFRSLYRPSKTQSEAMHDHQKSLTTATPIYSRSSSKRQRRRIAFKRRQSTVHESKRYGNWI